MLARLTLPQASGQAWIKILGKDPDNGASAALVKFDRGFRMPGRVSPVFSDSIVIDGQMTVGGRLCGRFS